MAKAYISGVPVGFYADELIAITTDVYRGGFIYLANGSTDDVTGIPVGQSTAVTVVADTAIQTIWKQVTSPTTTAFICPLRNKEE